MRFLSTLTQRSTVYAALVKLYEAKLAELNPSVPKITYTVADLNAFLDTYHDLSCLV
jgi:hypothetical protein